MSQIFYISIAGLNPETLVYEEFIESLTFNSIANDAVYRTHWHFIDRDPAAMENTKHIYYITDGENTLTNREDYSREDFAQYEDTFIVYENGNINYDESTYPNAYEQLDEDENITMYIAFEDEYMQDRQESWDTQRDTLFPMVIFIISSIIVALGLIIYLMAVTGRKPISDRLHSNWIDRIYTDILLVSFISIGVIWVGIIQWIYYIFGDMYNNFTMDQKIGLILIGIITAIVAALSIIILLAIVRKIKDKRFIKDLIFYRVYFRITDFLRSFFDGRRFAKFPLTKSLHQRQIVFIISSFFLVLLTFFLMWGPFLLLPPILEIVLIYWYIKYNNKTYEEINKGFDESLEEQMKSERMKLELITNVSHDLKTPLTSIISYVDLLSKEEELSESAKDYVNILADKSDRLKNIVSDLFDLAKSTSGDINLELETLDMKRLIEQTLGDMGDKIEKSGQQIKLKLPEEPVNIYSDGKKLYRVFQNVIDNALKYSLKGTRIFVELEKKDGKGIATIKNTSNYEMDFTSEEILQRFSRGDKSRTTDGSGLGLSIAESFTKVCGGDFNIDIDGDMFKIIISFELPV